MNLPYDLIMGFLKCNVMFIHHFLNARHYPECYMLISFNLHDSEVCTCIAPVLLMGKRDVKDIK